MKYNYYITKKETHTKNDLKEIVFSHERVLFQPLHGLLQP